MSTLEAVFSWVLTTTWQASLLAVLVLFAQWALGPRLNPRWRHALWLLVVLRLLLPDLPESALSLFRYAPAAPLNFPEVPQGVYYTATITPDQPGDPLRYEILVPQPLSLHAFLTILWLSGALALLLLTWLVNRRFAKHIAHAPPITDETLRQIFADARAELRIRRPIRLIESSQLSSPAIMGLFTPTLLLPRGARDKFTPRELRYIFLHELAHLKRGDVAIQALIALLQIVHWFNPVLWYAFRRLRLDREPATDALVLSRTGEADKEPYGLMLIKLLEHFNQRHALPTLVGILEDTDQFKRRFRLIARFTRGAYGWSLLGVLLIALLAAVCLTKAKAAASSAPTSTAVTPTAPQVAPIRIQALAIDIAESEYQANRERIDDAARQGHYLTLEKFPSARTICSLALPTQMGHATSGCNGPSQICLSIDATPKAHNGQVALDGTITFNTQTWTYKQATPDLSIKAIPNSAVPYHLELAPQQLQAAPAEGILEPATARVSPDKSPHRLFVFLSAWPESATEAAEAAATVSVTLFTPPAPLSDAQLAAMNAEGASQTPLLLALQQQNDDEARKLLAAGADVNAADKMGNNALAYFVDYAGISQPAPLDVLQTILTMARDPNPPIYDFTPRHASNPALNVALMGAAVCATPELPNARQIVKILLDHGATFAGANGDSQNLLQAAARGDISSARQLVANGTSVNVTDSEGWSPLLIACAIGDTDTANWLLDHGSHVNAPSKRGAEDPLTFAANRGDDALVERMLALGAKPDLAWRGVSSAINRNDERLFNDLISSGIDVKNGATAFESSGDKDWQRMITSEPLFTCIKNGQTSMALALLNHGVQAEPANVSNNQNYAYWAVHYDRPEILRALLQHGADPLLQDRQGDTPLSLAKKSHPDLVPIIESFTQAPSPSPTMTGNPPQLVALSGHIGPAQKPEGSLDITLVEIDDKTYTQQAKAIDQAVASGDLTYFTGKKNVFIAPKATLTFPPSKGWYSMGAVNSMVGSVVYTKVNGQTLTTLNAISLFTGINADFVFTASAARDILVDSTWSDTEPDTIPNPNFDPAKTPAQVPQTIDFTPKMHIAKATDKGWQIAPGKIHAFWLGPTLGQFTRTAQYKDKSLATLDSMAQNKVPSHLAVFLTAHLSGSDVDASPNGGPDTDAQLIAAVKAGDTATLQKLLDAGVDPDAKRSNPVYWAVYYHQTAALKLLLDHGAVVNQWDPPGDAAPLTLARTNHPDLAPMLDAALDKQRPAAIAKTKARLDAAHVTLAAATNVPLMDVLSQVTDQVRHSDPSGPGISLVLRHTPDTITLAALKNVSASDAIEAIADAAQVDYYLDADTVIFRPRGWPTNSISTRTFLVPSGFFATTSKGDVDMEPILAAHGINFPGFSSAAYLPKLGKAVIRDTPEELDKIAALFLALTNDTPAPAAPTSTPPSAPARNPALDQQLLNVVRDAGTDKIGAGGADQVAKLLAQGADPNAKNGGAPALVWALNFGKDNAAVLLIQNGADINASDHGLSVMEMASYIYYCPKALDALLRKGGRIPVPGPPRGSIMEEVFDATPPAAGKWNYLHDRAWTDAEYQAWVARQRQVIDLLAGAGVDVNGAPGGTPPLLKAIRTGHIEGARELLRLGARVDVHDAIGDPYSAARDSHPELLPDLEAAAKHAHEASNAPSTASPAPEVTVSGKLKLIPPSQVDLTQSTGYLTSVYGSGIMFHFQPDGSFSVPHLRPGVYNRSIQFVPADRTLASETKDILMTPLTIDGTSAHVTTNLTFDVQFGNLPKNSIEIELRLVEIEDGFYQANKARVDAAVDKADFQYFNNLEGVSILSTPSVTTTPGTKANIDIVREFPYPTSFEAGKIVPNQTLTMQGGGTTNVTLVIPPTPREFATKDVGVSAEITPTINPANSPDPGKIVLGGQLSITEFNGFTPSNVAGVNMPSFTTKESLFLEQVDDHQSKGIWIPGLHVSDEPMVITNRPTEPPPRSATRRLLLFVSAERVP